MLKISPLLILLFLILGFSVSAQIPNADEFNRTFTHHTATVNNIKLHYVIGGTGEPIVLLHGFAETWYMWRHVIPELAKKYTIIAPDLRGAGDSDKPTGGYDKKNMAEDIHQLVKSLGYEKIFLVGHDIGVMVSYAYAADHQDEVRKLVLLDAPIPGTKIFGKFENGPQAWHFTFHKVLNIPEALVIGRERAYLTEGFFRAQSYNPAAFTEVDVNEYVRAYSSPGGVKAGFEYFRAFDEDKNANALSMKEKLRMPVMALGGEQSLGQSMLEMTKEVASNVTGGSIEKCGHWIGDERPEYLTSALSTFFTK